MDELIKTLSKEKVLEAKILDSLKKINKAEQDPFKRLSLLLTESKNIDRNLSKSFLDPSIKEQIKSEIIVAKSEISDIEQKVKTHFGSKLATLLNEKGFKLEGNYPKLRASMYSFTIDVLANKVDVYYGMEFEKIGTCIPIPDDVASCMLEYHEKLTQRQFDTNKFLKDLFDAYNICILQKNKKIGDEIPVSDVLSAYAFVIQDNRFKKNPLKNYYVEYDRILFSYDLYRLKQRVSNGVELKLVTARRGETKNRLDFLWIPSQKGIGESISRIKFTEAK